MYSWPSLCINFFNLLFFVYKPFRQLSTTWREQKKSHNEAHIESFPTSAIKIAFIEKSKASHCIWHESRKWCLANWVEFFKSCMTKKNLIMLLYVRKIIPMMNYFSCFFVARFQHLKRLFELSRELSFNQVTNS